MINSVLQNQIEAVERDLLERAGHQIDIVDDLINLLDRDFVHLHTLEV